MTDLRPFSIHPTIRNKPPLWQPEFASSWQGRSGDLQALRDHVSAGGAFIPAALTGDHRTSAAFLHSELAVVDVDHGLTLEQLQQHPLGAYAAWVYTTANHSPATGAERFRVVFQLPRRIEDPDLYKAIITLLSRSLGGDKSCTDPCRLFYGNDQALHPIWQPKAVLTDSILEDAEAEAQQTRLRYDRSTAYYEERTIQQAIFCLEQVLAPTSDGQRDHFVKVTAAASSAGDAIFPAWSDWASRGHHGSGKNARQASDKFFRGFHGRSTLATLFYLANEEKPDWRNDLPPELVSDGSSSFAGFKVAGYDHEDFLGLQDEENERPRLATTATPGLFDEERPWLAMAPPPPTRRPGPPLIADPAEVEPPDFDAPDPDLEEDDEDFLDDPHAHLFGDGPAGEEPPAVRQRRGGNGADEDTVQRIKDRLQLLYPGLRLNAMSLNLEYGPKDSPRRVNDISTAYVRISRGSGTVFPKTLVYDVAQVIGFENQYHPVRTYLENCAANVPACPYFKRLATELLGLPDDPIYNPTFEDGRHFADAIMERFLVGAIARVFNPGCDHDWMPILIGSQNSGKSTFLRYLTPPDPTDPGTYPWVSTVQQGITYIKDRPHVLHAAWLVILDEAERYFKRKYVEELKNLISVPVDRSARKYENERDFRRSFVLCGATNSSDFLVDPTGNRRFMPITVAGKVPSPQSPKIKMIDLDRLKADRDAIWSAAYKAYLDGAPHVWTSYELSTMSSYLEGFTGDSPLDALLARALEVRRSGIWRGTPYVTIADVYDWLDIPVTQQSQMQQPIADTLKRMGWVLRRTTMNNRQVRMWIRPDS